MRFIFKWLNAICPKLELWLNWHFSLFLGKKPQKRSFSPFYSLIKDLFNSEALGICLLAKLQTFLVSDTLRFLSIREYKEGYYISGVF